MIGRSKSFWSHTPIATFVGIVAFVILAFGWSILVAPVAFYLTPWTKDNFFATLLVGIMLVYIPFAGLVILARLIASHLSEGKAVRPTTLIAGGLTLLYFAFSLVYWVLTH